MILIFYRLNIFLSRKFLILSGIHKRCYLVLFETKRLSGHYNKFQNTHLIMNTELKKFNLNSSTLRILMFWGKRWSGTLVEALRFSSCIGVASFHPWFVFVWELLLYLPAHVCMDSWCARACTHTHTDTHTHRHTHTHPWRWNC